MNSPISMNRQVRKAAFFPVCLALPLLCSPYFSYSQCTAAPIPPAACSGGNGAASDGLSIGAAKTYYVTGSAIFNSITLNGGTLRICGTLIVSTLNLTSGNLIIESGGTLITTSLSTINGGITIINRGSFTASGGATIQGTNHIYNDLSTSVMTISGTVTFPGSSTTVVNRGNMTFSSLSYSAGTGSFCLQDNSLTNIGVLDNEATDAFTYSGAGSPACLNVTSQATLGHDLTTSSLIHVCKGNSTTVSGGATGHPGGGWGSATVYSNCTSCATVLSLNFLSFTAEQQSGGVRLQWSIDEDARNSEIFYVERSSDGSGFHTISSLESITGQSSYTAFDTSLTDPVQYYRIRAILPTGLSAYSSITSVATGTTGPQQLMAYPNPVGSDRTINMRFYAATAGTARLLVIDMAGQIIRTKNIAMTQGNNQPSWNLGNISAGTYLIRIELSGEKSLYSRIAVLNP